jgi:hypothetical protein
VVTGHLLLAYHGDMEQRTKTDLNVTAGYDILILGKLDKRWTRWFGDAKITEALEDNNLFTTKIRCFGVDQVKLRGMLNKIWDLNLELIAVQRLPSASQADDFRAGRAP